MNDFKVETQARVFLCASNQSVHVDEYVSSLEALGHAVYLGDVKELNDLIQIARTPPDALLVFVSEIQLDVLRIMRETHFGTVPPIVIFLTEETNLGRSEHFLSLPVEPHIALPQIQTYLHIRAENTVLRREIKEVASERDLLADTVETQKRAKHAVELLKNAIVRNVSHELRTPLLQIKAAVSLIGEDPDNPELVNLAKAATARLETLVKNIAMLGSSLDLNRSAVIVHETVEYAKRNLGRIGVQRAAIERIVSIYSPNLPLVYADKVGLGTVIQLLVDNALKFSNDTVTVAAEEAADEIVFEIRDNGIGIPDSQLERIFELFYQIESSTTRKYGGTGVGLALAKLILENHETDIHVYSKVGKGTKFTFKLPVYKW